MQINTCTSDFSNVLYVATGSCDALSCVTFNRGGCGGTSQGSTISNFYFSTGTTYYIITGASQTSAGRTTLRITGTPFGRCAGAARISSLPFSYTGDTSTLLPDFSCSSGSGSIALAGKAMWFSYQPATTIRNVYIGTCDASFDTILHLVTGSCGSIQCSRNDDNSCFTQSGGSLISSVTLNQGVQYYIVVTSASASAFGPFTLTVEVDSTASLSISAPTNNALLGGSAVDSVVVSGVAGRYDAGGTVSILFQDSSAVTSDISISAIVQPNFSWSTAATSISTLVDPSILITAITDLAGNTATASVTVIKDTTVSVLINTPADLFVNFAEQSSYTISGRGEAASDVAVRISDGRTVLSVSTQVGATGDWSIVTPFSSLLDGQLTVSASIQDLAGNQADSNTLYLTKDTVPPNGVISSPLSGFLPTSLSLSGTGEPGANVDILVADSSPITADIPSSTIVNAQGSWSLSLNVGSQADGLIFVRRLHRGSADHYF